MLTDFIWDFDGMLFDSYPHITAAFIEANRRLGGAAIDYESCYALFKKSFNTAYAHYRADDRWTLLFRALESDRALEPRVQPYPGIPEMLREVVAKGGRNYLNTRRDSVALTYLEKAGLLGLFTDCVTSESSLPPKPAPDTVVFLVEKFGLERASTVMLGDRRVDIDAGAAAGVRTCLFDEKGDLSSVSCDWYLRDTRELPRLLLEK